MFNEANTVEELVRDLLCGPQPAGKALAEPPPGVWDRLVRNMLSDFTN